MGKELEKQESFPHQGYDVTIAHWVLNGRAHLRAEIRFRSVVVCILSRSGPAENSTRLLQKLRGGAIRWIDHHY
ncbi:hypothetical protein [Variovorax sp. DT-64]|uniref:hypothetical protein n=1 Tax=Variovorax sp. DT-64 TaxID=3396160 RepID=UPI003F1A198F